jgi:hypothetical protein
MHGARSRRRARAAKRAIAAIALALTASGVVAVALRSDAREHFDPNINREVSYREAREFAFGTPRAIVERRLGPGGEAGSHDFTEPVGTRCRYYTRSGRYAGEYVQLCYLSDRLATIRIATDRRLD